MYLTDGVFLYRVVGSTPGSAGPMVELEDCYLLDVVSVTLSEVRARKLRVVTPDGLAPADAIGAGPVRAVSDGSTIAA